MKPLPGMDGGYIKGLPAGVVLQRIEFTKAENCFLYDSSGCKYLDMSAGLTVPFGHCNSRVREAVYRASEEIDACEDYSSVWRRSLIERLQKIMPEMCGGVQFYSAGTEAVEASLRFAKRITGKDGVLSCFGAYHGKTRASVSAGNASAVDGLRIPGYIKAPFAYCPGCPIGLDKESCAMRCASLTRETVRQTVGENLGAILVEPVQGFAGVVVPPVEFLAALQDLAQERGAVVIFDEIFSGLGRSGSLFAYQRMGLRHPDIITIGKGLGNGYPISAVLVSERHVEKVSEVEGGTSFGGNPMSCAAALETLSMFESVDWRKSVARLEQCLSSALNAMATQHEVVSSVSVYGAMAAVRFRSAKPRSDADEPMEQIVYRECLKSGLLVTPGAGFIRLTPPLTMEIEHADAAMDILRKVLEHQSCQTLV